MYFGTLTVTSLLIFGNSMVEAQSEVNADATVIFTDNSSAIVTVDVPVDGSIIPLTNITLQSISVDVASAAPTNCEVWHSGNPFPFVISSQNTSYCYLAPWYSYRAVLSKRTDEKKAGIY
jgi:hypothetical protein